MSFCICHHGAAINKNHDGKILPTLFFMLMKTKCKRKTESHNERLNTQLYRIKCYSSCFFFSFLPQNCSGFTIEILIIVIKCFLIFVPFLILSLFHNDVYVMLYSIFKMECTVLIFLFQKQLFKEHSLRHTFDF